MIEKYPLPSNSAYRKNSTRFTRKNFFAILYKIQVAASAIIQESALMSNEKDKANYFPPWKLSPSTMTVVFFPLASSNKPCTHLPWPPNSFFQSALRATVTKSSQKMTSSAYTYVYTSGSSCLIKENGQTLPLLTLPSHSLQTGRYFLHVFFFLSLPTRNHLRSCCK